MFNFRSETGKMYNVQIAHTNKNGKIKKTECIIRLREVKHRGRGEKIVFTPVSTGTSQVHPKDREHFTNKELRKFGIIKSLHRALMGLDEEHPIFSRNDRVLAFEIAHSKLNPPANPTTD